MALINSYEQIQKVPGHISDTTIHLPDTIGSDGQVMTVVAGSPTWSTAVDGMTNPMTTGGDLIYGGASGVPARLANGTSGQLLSSSGGTNAPIWINPVEKPNYIVNGELDWFFTPSLQNVDGANRPSNFYGINQQCYGVSTVETSGPPTGLRKYLRVNSSTGASITGFSVNIPSNIALALYGKTLCLSFYAKQTVGTLQALKGNIKCSLEYNSFVSDQACYTDFSLTPSGAMTSSWVRYYYSFTVGGSYPLNYMGRCFSINITSTSSAVMSIDFAGIKLEEGTTPTALNSTYHPMASTFEQACRFFYPMSAFGHGALTYPGRMTSTTAGTFWVNVPFATYGTALSSSYYSSNISNIGSITNLYWVATYGAVSAGAIATSYSAGQVYGHHGLISFNTTTALTNGSAAHLSRNSGTPIWWVSTGASTHDAPSNTTGWTLNNQYWYY